ncbi:hypothetical protein [Agromyces rhizosphaerae]|nr:hypothetical protein [Agromyces rhizosphaerae]
MDRRTLRRTTAALALAASALLLLAACTPGTSAIEHYDGAPEEYDSAYGSSSAEGLQVFVLENGDKLAITLYGSSSCPWIGETIAVTAKKDEGNAVEIEVRPLPDNTACTQDYVPHTTVFWTPKTYVETNGLTVTALGQSLVLQ